MLAEVHRFDDAQAHAAAVSRWQQVYDQISAGSFDSTLTQFSLDGLQVYREIINQRVVQHGETPPRMVHFAVPVVPPQQSSLQGCPVGSDTIMALRGNEEFLFHVAPNMDCIQVSIGYDELALLAPSFIASLEGSRRGQPVIRVNAERLFQARCTLLETMGQLVENRDLLSFEGTRKLVKHQFISLLLDLLSDAEPESRRDITHATYSDIVKRSQAIVLATPDEPVTVLDLCQQLRVSRRTLQNGFQQVAYTTPVDYLRSIRLNGVRRTLLAGPRDGSIRDAAGHWGFYHLGHFSRDYRKLFGELPSETRARG